MGKSKKQVREKLWEISSKTTGGDLGIFRGRNIKEALDAMAKNAGFKDHRHYVADLGTHGTEELIVKEVGVYGDENVD